MTFREWNFFLGCPRFCDILLLNGAKGLGRSPVTVKAITEGHRPSAHRAAEPLRRHEARGIAKERGIEIE